MEGHKRREPPQAAPAAPRLREIDIERQCSDFLALDSWRPLKTDPCCDIGRGKGFGEAGMADHLYIRYLPPEAPGPGKPRADRTALAEVLWVEYKRPGGRISDGQHQWATIERLRGALVWLATEDFEPTFEGFVAHYRASGLLERQGL